MEILCSDKIYEEAIEVAAEMLQNRERDSENLSTKPASGLEIQSLRLIRASED